MAVKITGQFVNCKKRTITKKDGSASFDVFEGSLVDGSHIIPCQFAKMLIAKVGENVEFNGYAKFDKYKNQIIYVENK